MFIDKLVCPYSTVK